MSLPNEGFNPENIKAFKAELQKSGKNYVRVNDEDNSEEYVNFQFVGMYEGREVIYDAAIYTLRLQHSSEIYEIAEHKAAQKFPNYKPIEYKEDENGDFAPLDPVSEEIGLFMAEIMADLEDDEAVKVQEHVELDPNISYGIGLDAGLNIDKVTHEVITKFIKDFNDDNLKLDETLYSFVNEEDDEDDDSF
jgi:hypothetical protein